MGADTLSISTLADEAYRSMDRRTRVDGTDYYAPKDDAAEWVRDMIRVAHGGMMPDDWRYDCIHSALGHISDTGADDTDDLDDAGHEFADRHVDAYSAARLEWLSSNLMRAGYCDEAEQEVGYPGIAEGGIFQMIGLGQYAESLEVFESVRQSLAERMDDLNA